MPQPTEKIEQLVAEWNEYYEDLGTEVQLEDLAPKAYEEEILSAIHGVCGSWTKALEVFEHKDNKGGWMYGDVGKRLKQNAKKEAK